MRSLYGPTCLFSGACHALPQLKYTFETFSVIIKIKNLPIKFSMVYTLIEHWNDSIKCSKLCAKTTRLRIVVSLERFYRQLFRFQTTKNWSYTCRILKHDKWQSLLQTLKHCSKWAYIYLWNSLPPVRLFDENSNKCDLAGRVEHSGLHKLMRVV